MKKQIDLKDIYIVAKRINNTNYDVNVKFFPEIQGEDTNGSWDYILTPLSNLDVEVQISNNKITIDGNVYNLSQTMGQVPYWRVQKNLKLFVGGYYDDRIFDGEYFEGTTQFNKEIDTYTLDEVLKLAFVENVVQWYEEENEKDFYLDTTFEEKAKAIEEYTCDDEIAGILYFETEEEAEDYKQKIIKEVEDKEKNAVFVDKKQDKYGYWREVYVAKDDVKEVEDDWDLEI